MLMIFIRLLSQPSGVFIDCPRFSELGPLTGDPPADFIYFGTGAESLGIPICRHSADVLLPTRKRSPDYETTKSGRDQGGVILVIEASAPTCKQQHAGLRFGESRT